MHWSRIACAALLVLPSGSALAQCPPVSTHIGFHRENVGASLAAEGDEAFFGHYRGFSVGVYARGADDAWTRVGIVGGSSTSPIGLGTAVDRRGDTAVAGDPLDLAGTIAIFERIAGTWTTVSTFRSPTTGTPWFGSAVAVADDRTSIAAGAPHENNAGAAYLYSRGPTGWVFDAALAPTGGVVASDGFGTSVAVAAGRVFVGAPGRNNGTGAVFVFERRAGAWTQTAELAPTGAAARDRWGSAIVADATRMLASAPGRVLGSMIGVGEVVDYHLASGTWTETARIAAAPPVATGAFGVALDLAGTRLAVGSRGNAYVFDAATPGWRQIAAFTFPDSVQTSEFGAAVALYSRGLLVGAPQYDNNGFNYPDSMGAVHAYDLTDQGQRLVACGHSISRWSNSRRLLLDAPTEANRMYLIAGSVTGTGPINVGNLSIPLTIDAYFLFTLGHPNSPILPGGLGLLDSAGRGRADFVIPTELLAELVGLNARHAFVAFRSDLTPAIASNAVSVIVVP